VETIDPGVAVRRLSGTRRKRRSLIPTRALIERYNVCDRTIDRWTADPELGFPKPRMIRKRRYWDEAELDDFDAALASATP
jgi:predicted DNA-binding transcriptional regulator AlpA